MVFTIHYFTIAPIVHLHHVTKYVIIIIYAQKLCAVRAVLQALGRLHKKEDLSAVLTVFHMQKEKSVMKQVISQPISFM